MCYTTIVTDKFSTDKPKEEENQGSGFIGNTHSNTGSRSKKWRNGPWFVMLLSPINMAGGI
jgi:hypothetical protein